MRLSVPDLSYWSLAAGAIVDERLFMIRGEGSAGSDKIRLSHPGGDVALSVKDAPDINVVGPLQVEHQVRILLQRPEA